MQNMRHVGNDPAEVEAASLPAFIHTIRAHAELGAPEPPHNSLRHEIGITTNETDEDPVIARTRVRWQRRRKIALRQEFEQRQRKLCRRKEHEMTDDNTYRGKNGDQCRACRNASRRAA